MARIPRFTPTRNISQVAADPGPTSAAGAGFGALAELARRGEQVVKPAAITQAREKGINSVYRDENGVLKIDEANRLGGELADQQNSAAYAKYLSQRTIDVRDTMTELAVQYEFDPAGFRAATDAYIETLQEDEAVPTLLREDVVSQAQREASARFNGLMVSEVNRTQRDANLQTTAHRDALADDYVNLMMSGDTEAAAEKYAEMQALTEYRQTASYITETPAQSEAYLTGVRGAARAAQLTRRLENLSGAREISDEEREEIQALVDSPDLDPRTRANLYSATQGRLKGIDGRAAADALAAQDISAAVRNYGFGAGDDAAYMAATRSAESSGDPNARNPRSSATGLYQFTSGTWNDLMRRRPELGLTPEGRTDPRQQERAMRAFTAENVETLRNAGISPTNPNKYAAHFLGAGDAIRVLNAPDGTPLGSMLSDTVMEANPFLQGMDVADFKAWTQRKMGQAAAPAIDVAGNREALVSAGIDVTPGAEFAAGALGVGAAQAMYAADPAQPVSEVLDPEVIEANPVLSGMTVDQARAWADRRAVVKSSDIAARRTQIDDIQDPEVRRIALNSLNEIYNQRRREEDQSAAAYEERLNANDDTLTEMEVMTDHSLSDQAQRALVSEIRDMRRDQIEAAETIASLSDPSTAWDMYDSGQRNQVDKAYTAMLDGADPMSMEGQMAAASVTARTGFVPKTIFNALRGAVNGGDAAGMASALEFAGQITERFPGALRPHGGYTEVQSALDDFRFYTQFMGAEEATARMIENNLPENQRRRQNLTDEARDHAKDLDASDITNHFSDMDSDVDIPEQMEPIVMGDYDRLFRDHFTRTGDVDLAKNRALSEISRTYGPSGVNGSERIMRLPPTKFYAPVNGSHDWMGSQLVDDVSAFVLGDDYERGNRGAVVGNAWARLLVGGGGIDSDRIMLTSDDRTQRDVAAGEQPSYVVRYLDDDDVIQEIPGRYRFERPADADVEAQAEVAAEMGQAGQDRNLRMWIDHYSAQGMPMNEYNSLIMQDFDRHTTTAPPGM